MIDPALLPWLVPGLLALVAILLIVLLIVVIIRTRSTGQDALAPLATKLEGLERGQERTERTIRDEGTQHRNEAQVSAKALREEVGNTLGLVRESVERRLEALQKDNAAKLEQMRATVDEKLQGTLDKRLGESFRQVSERLEQVHKGLGEMQTLASGVGDLKKVLSNVKSRGSWGEVQLEALLEQVLAPDQYEKNVATRELAGERVEFAVKLPGPDGSAGDSVFLPIDAKFPLEDYTRLVEASQLGDVEAVEGAVRGLETAVKKSAKDIHDKYIGPPRTTDFAIMFLPTEGLYAEVLRRPGLVEHLQRQCRVVPAGPTTLWAVLNSLQMGFRTLTIQKRSSEVWKLLGAVKHEFGTFGGVLDAVQKNLQRASNKIDGVRKTSRTIEQKLGAAEEMTTEDRVPLLAGLEQEMREEMPEETQEEGIQAEEMQRDQS